jgi:hypothetical protein
MGIFGMINAKKEQFRNATVEMRKKAILRKAERVENDNVRENDLAVARQRLDTAQTINQDLKGSAPLKPNKLQTFGSNLKKHMDKNKTSSKKTKKMIGTSTAGNVGGSSTSQGGIFGGARNLEVGGGSSGGDRFGGQRNLEFGGGGGSPFNSNPRNKK